MAFYQYFHFCLHAYLFLYLCPLYIYFLKMFLFNLLLIEKERDMDLMLHPFMHSLVASWMCPDQGSNPQPWRTRTTL